MAFESCNTNIKSNVRAQYPERCCCTINIREYKNVPLTFIFTAERQKRDLSLSRWSVVKLRRRRSRASFRKAARSKKSRFFLVFLLFFPPPKNDQNRQKIQSHKTRDKTFIKPRSMMTMVSSNRRFEKKTPFRMTILMMMIIIVALFSTCSAVSAQEQQEGGLSRKFSIHNTDKDSKEDFKDSDGDGVGDFKDAFVSSLAMILVAELGDETFIIAAIMAMRHPRLIVLSGALSALAIMTVLSTAMGVLAPMLISPKVVNKCAFVLYTFFGCRLFYIAWRSKPGSSMQDEVDEVAEKIDVEKAPKGKIRRILSRVCTPIFLEAFVLTFLAEWGDRSQITTIALAAHKDPYGVTIGAIIGHAFCTSLAVIGGKILALKISQRLVAAVGGMLFIVFAWHALIFGAPGTELSKND